VQAEHRRDIEFAVRPMVVYRVRLNEGCFSPCKGPFHARSVVLTERTSGVGHVFLHLHEMMLHFRGSSIVLAAVQPAMEALNHLVMPYLNRFDVASKPVSTSTNGIAPCLFVGGLIKPKTHQRPSACSAVAKFPRRAPERSTEVEDQAV